MPTGTLRINNNTDFTPTLENIVLTGCAWLPTQVLKNGQSIAPNGLVQGTVELPTIQFPPYSIVIELRYYTLGPNPKSDGGTVRFRCGRKDVDGMMMAFGSDDGSTPHADINYHHSIQEADNDVFVLDISPT